MGEPDSGVIRGQLKGGVLIFFSFLPPATPISFSSARKASCTLACFLGCTSYLCIASSLLSKNRDELAPKCRFIVPDCSSSVEPAAEPLMFPSLRHLDTMREVSSFPTGISFSWQCGT